MKRLPKTSRMAEDLPIFGLLQDAVLSLCRRSYPKSPGLEVDAIICISMSSSSRHHVVKIHEKIGTDNDTNRDTCDADGNNSDFDSESCYALTKQDNPVTERCPDVRITMPLFSNLSTSETNLCNSDEIQQNTAYMQHGDAENEILSSNSNTKNVTVVKTEPASVSTECKLNYPGTETHVTKINTNIVNSCNQVDLAVVQDSGISQNINMQKSDITEKIDNACFSSGQWKLIDSGPKYSQKNDMCNSLTHGKLVEHVEGIVIKQEPLFETGMVGNPLNVISDQILEFRDISSPKNNHYLEKTGKIPHKNCYHNSGQKRKMSGSNNHFDDEQIYKIPQHTTIYLANQNISGMDYTCTQNDTRENFTCNTDSTVSQILEQERTASKNLISEDDPLSDIMQSSLSCSGLDSKWFNNSRSKMIVQLPQKMPLGHLQQISEYPNKSRHIYSDSGANSSHQESPKLKKLAPSLNFSSSFPFQTSTGTAHNDPSDVVVTFNGCASQTMNPKMSKQKLDQPSRTHQSVFSKQPSNLTLLGKNLSKEKKYFCKNCGAGFTELFNKLRHEKTTCGVMCYTCTICNHTFSRSDSMSRHMFHVHGVRKSPIYIGNMPVM